MSKPNYSLIAFKLIGFLSITSLAIHVFGGESAIVGQWIEPSLARGVFDLGKGSIALYTSFWPFPILNEIWGRVCPAFIPSTLETDPITWWQMFSFLADAAPVYAIWVLESNRDANSRSTAYLPWIWAQIFQVIGGCVAAPLYYLGHLLTAPSASMLTRTSRTIESRNAKTLLLSLLITYYLPFLGAYLSPSNETRHWWTWLWQMFPIWAGISQAVLLSVMSPEQPNNRTGDKYTTRDMFWVRLTMSTTGTFSASFWIYTFLCAPYPMRDIFVPKGLLVRGSGPAALRNMLQWDQVLFFAAPILWLLFLARDLRRGRLTPYGWPIWAFILALLTLAVGPGAAISAGWLVREELLARDVMDVDSDARKRK